MKNEMKKEDVIAAVKDKDVGFIRLQFTDMLGNLKNMAVTASQLERALDHAFMFDGYSINGFSVIEKSDMVLCPDLSSFTIFPWRPQHGKVARLICDVCTQDGQPFSDDPRFILKKAIAAAAEKGYTLMVEPECEFFLFHTDENGLPTTITHEQAGYLDLSPLDLGENARRDIVLTLEDMGFTVIASHHETAPAQHEVDFARGEALEAADNIMTFKMVVRTIAKRHGLHATFMPKPKETEDGSGMHLKLSLFKDGKNVFAGSADGGALSKEGEAFMCGVLAHIGGISALTNPLVNSYKRLLTGFSKTAFEDGKLVVKNNYIHIPAARGEDTCIELRSPDSAANPYLALAAILTAGLSGIEAGSRFPETKEACFRLPDRLETAVEAFENDSLIRMLLGESCAEKYADAKKSEALAYNRQVTDWELKQYLYRY